MIARRSLCPEKLGSNPGQGSKGINFSGWHGLDMSVTVTRDVKLQQTNKHQLDLVYVIWVTGLEQIVKSLFLLQFVVDSPPLQPYMHCTTPMFDTSNKYIHITKAAYNKSICVIKVNVLYNYMHVGVKCMLEIFIKT